MENGIRASRLLPPWREGRQHLACALLALVCAFSGVRASAQTTFAVIGDYGDGSQAEADVAALVHGWGPEFFITLGDNNYTSGSASTIDPHIGQYYHSYIYPYKGTYGAGASTNRFWPSLGNHDWATTGAQPYLNYFTLPGNERYYDFVRGPVHFFCLDSDTHEPDGTSSTSTQGAWLKNRLAASTEPWKVVFFHHPPYSSGASHGSSSWMQWPFQAWGASIVLGGHDHVYERIVRNGFTYIVNGLGGASLYGFSSTPVSGSIVRYSSDYGAQRAIATSTELTFEFINRRGVLIDSFTLSKSTATTPPAAPTSLTASAASSSQINLTWVDNATDETGFAIERSPNGTTFTQVASVGANSTSYSNTGLAASTTYSYRVRAVNDAGNSSYSNVAKATTTASSGATVRPYAPSGLAASAASTSQITLTWKDNSGVEDGYRIERATGSSTSFVEIAVVGPNVISYANTGLSAATTYTYRVRGFNSVGSSAYSNTASATTLDGGGVPAPAEAPDLTARAVSRSQIALAWTDPVSDETGYRIERSKDGTTFALVTTVGANVTKYSNTGLSAGTVYTYRVRANSSSTTYPWSNTASAKTYPVSPLAPSSLTAKAVSTSQITLTWKDNSGVEDGYKIERATGSSSFVQIGVIGANATSYASTGLSAGTTYTYRVRAYNITANSAYSNTASATTLR